MRGTPTALRFRLACTATLLALTWPATAQLPTDFSSQSALDSYASALPAPQAPDNSVDWFDGQDRTPYSLAVSNWHFGQYYQEASARFGTLPDGTALLGARTGWLLYLLSLTGADKFTGNPPDRGWEWGWTVATPEIPLVNREVSSVNYRSGFRRPHLPPLRWTRDGRLGLVADIGGVDGKPQPLRIQLNRPEGLQEHFVDSAPGVPSMDPATWEVPDYTKWGLPGSNLAQFATLCEAAPATPAQANPYTCGSDDCYDLTLVGTAVQQSYDTSAQVGKEGGIRTQYLPQLQPQDRLFSRQLTIRVSQPKTPQARISAVDIGRDVRVAPIRQGVLFEPVTPADGRLLVARRAGLPLVWRHSATGRMHAGNYETVYAVAPQGGPACDVTQWGDLMPISHAPFDPRVKDKYLFAKYPFRDPMGNAIPDGADIKGTYPWIDKDAKVLSLMISDANLFGGGYLAPKERYPNRCVHDGCKRGDRDATNDLTYMLLGGWSKGKGVVIDNLLNFADFRLTLSNALWLDLYRPGSALPVTANRNASVEVGGSRSLSHSEPNSLIPLKDRYGYPVLGSDGQPQSHLVKNSSVFDTIDHRLNYNPHMKPVSPHDVVWTLSSGVATDEFSFDDLLNDHAFIVSDMVAAFSAANDSLFRMTAYDGWNKLWGDWRGQVKVQNAATTLPHRWVVPRAGDVANGRIEPVANGGIKGKGLYFNGQNTHLLYDIPSTQPQSMSAASWFHSLFLDVRAQGASEEQVILNFPDKSRLTMKDASANVSFQAYNNNGELQKVFLVPTSLVRQRWFHLGLQTAPDGRSTVYVNGYPWTEFAATRGSLFQMRGGALVLGRGHHDYEARYDGFWNWLWGKSTASPANYRAFQGWMDEYKVFAQRPDPESICNLANGTLVAVGSNAQLGSQAALYPSAMHERISNALRLRGQATHARYACHMGDPAQGRTAALHRLPAGAVGIRASMHFPEGPLYHDAPRPDSTSNEFCLACHSTTGVGGLTVEALRYRSVPARSDPRRQPMQAPPFITGNLPSSFVSAIGGNWAALGSNHIDDYIQPSAQGLAPEIRNLVFITGGAPSSVLNAGATVVRSSFSAIRVNASGLAGRAQIRVNGSLVLDDAMAPFDLPAASLVIGSNQLSVTTFSANGMQSQRSYTITVR
ncbi:MAG: hypothetical protein K0Q68_2176 [Moraxellaceae bacterium]|jgi:hypothetical protein|nr:hypothetical protein [Moraxellaceae bacterium]